MSKILLRIFLVPFEFIFSKLNNWQPIPGSEEKIFLINLKEFKGNTVHLQDGTVISTGDKVGVLHLNNNHIIDLENSVANLYRLMDYEFTKLSESLDQNYRGVKAFYCETVLYSLLCRKGFQASALPDNLLTHIKGFWFKILKNTFTVRQSPTKRNRKPKTCWISAAKLKKKFTS